MPYGEVKYYGQIPAPEILDAGIADVMKTPSDGVNRKTFINWVGARFAVVATTDTDGQPRHQIIINYHDEASVTGRWTHAMAIGLDQRGRPEAVATVSGDHREGMSRLSDEQTQVLEMLIQYSIDAGGY